MFYKIMSAKLNTYEDSDPEASNDFIDLEFIARKTSKKSSTANPVSSYEKNLDYFNHTLIKILTIFTGKRISSNSLRKQLKNYQFKKNCEKKLFGSASQEIKKEQQFIIMTLISLMREFRKNADRLFYIVYTKNDEEVFYFKHVMGEDQNIQTVLIISSQSSLIKQSLQTQKIVYKELYEMEETHNHHKLTRLMIKNQHINIFWGMIFNKLISQNKSFEVISNFHFLNSFQSTHTEIYNGIEMKEGQKYEHLSEDKRNILGDRIIEVFKLKMEGYWTIENIRRVVEKLSGSSSEGSRFHLQMSQHHCTKSFHHISEYL